MLKSYVINLDRSKDRLEFISKVFAQNNLSFIRVDAVDGRRILEEDFKHLTAVNNWDQPLTHAEVGCFLSHRECLRLIAEGDEPFGAVFEDDIILSSHASLFLQDANWIPKNIDIVKIDTAKKRCLVGAKTVSLDQGYSLAPLISKHYCAGGYIVSKVCAARLYALTALVAAPIDELYFNPDCGLLQTMNVQQMIPAIVVQAGLESTIRSSHPIEEPRKRSKLSFFSKLKREYTRLEKKQLYPLRMMLFHRCRWLIIPFK